MQATYICDNHHTCICMMLGFVKKMRDLSFHKSAYQDGAKTIYTYLHLLDNLVPLHLAVLELVAEFLLHQTTPLTLIRPHLQLSL